MKNLILALTVLLPLSGFAHEIQGTLILKGALKTKIAVNSVKTTCKVKVEKVKNLKVEDSFGNPGYEVRVAVSLDGRDTKREIKIDFNKDFYFTNLFQVGAGSEVRDLDYASADGAKMMINAQGRLRSVVFPYSGRLITCSF